MVLTFQPITLDTDAPDRDATLVLRDGRLLAVLCCLSDIHEEAGHWFLEVAFADLRPAPVTWETLEAFEAWLQKTHP